MRRFPRRMTEANDRGDNVGVDGTDRLPSGSSQEPVLGLDATAATAAAFGNSGGVQGGCDAAQAEARRTGTGASDSARSEDAQAPEAQDEARRAALIMERVAALMVRVHASSRQYPPPAAAVATSAVLGWGHDTLLHLLDKMLAEGGLLRGRGAG